MTRELLDGGEVGAAIDYAMMCAYNKEPQQPSKPEETRCNEPRIEPLGVRRFPLLTGAAH